MTDSPAPLNLFQAHHRTFRSNRFVYPVLSRRAAGLSIGINLNLDRVCNFNCVYCQVDRSGPVVRDSVDLKRLAAELDASVELVASGQIYQDPQFSNVPPHLRRLNDIAFSGDGEPTTCRHFDEVVALAAEVRRRHHLDDVKLVLITNASRFHLARVQRAMALLDATCGEVWAKLDAGTEDYYRLVARTKVPFKRILDNLLLAARARPLVIQSLFVRLRGEPPPAAELEAYCGRLEAIVSGGGRVKLVQVHTIARPPAETWVTALTPDELERLAALIRRTVGLTVAVY